MQKYFQIVVPPELTHPNTGTNWLTEVKMRLVNDFYRVEQLHLLKLKAFLNFESSTHSVIVTEWVELSKFRKAFNFNKCSCSTLWRIFTSMSQFVPIFGCISFDGIRKYFCIFICI